MGLSRTTKIYILLAIDVCFFFAELITGYAVGSLALVADSFHMLNDVMSLVVALYAIKLTGKNASTAYSYGWHRAEILAALVNATFLLALCFSIFMEAIERFVNVPEVSNPKLVVILGCFGLGSNIVGLFLFHDHGNSHAHSHGHGDHDHKHSLSTNRQKRPSPHQNSETDSLLISSSSEIGTPTGNGNGRRARSRSPSVSSLFGHPAQTRAAVVATAQSLASSPPPSMSPLAHRRSSSSARGRPARSHSRHNSIHIAPGVMDDITEVNSGTGTPYVRGRSISPHNHGDGRAHDHDHGREPFKHTHAADLEAAKSQRRHSHGSMNMRALVLHVMGDALGNLGVIGSGLIIWLTTWQYRYYSDPIISLIITCIIFSSALPLVKSASFILLQGVPESVNLEDVREDISAVDGVVSIHELHVWQLSESKHVASVHILLRKKDDFMRVVRDIRRVLHEHDIHNGTIQPEFGDFGEVESEHASPSITCLVTCPPGMCQDQTCCPTPLPLSAPGGSSPS